MAINIEVDSVLKMSFKYLHSSTADSAEKIRNSLDEIIRHRYGSAKMLANTLNKKILLEETLASETNKNLEQKDISGSLKNLEMTQANSTISLHSSDAISIASEEENLTEFSDLACVLCGGMVVTVSNRLVECSDCQLLYHQECHKPSISENDASQEESSWCCYNCKNKIILNEVISTQLATTTNPFIKTQEQLSAIPSTSTNSYSGVEIHPVKENILADTLVIKGSNTPPLVISSPIHIPEKISSEKRLHSKKKGSSSSSSSSSKHQDSKRKK